MLDGLLLGCGDAVIGINPASDSPRATAELLHLLDDIRLRYEIPMQSCVLSHVTTTMDLIEMGAPVDLVFQSIAGTEGANTGFGVTLEMLAKANEAGRAQARHRRRQRHVPRDRAGRRCRRAPTRTAAVDQQTLEARAYAVARALDPLLVNTVVGFIGPEYLYDGKQIVRAGLEDHFCGKLLGLPMGVRRLLHQPRRGRPERHGHPADAARGGGRQLHHGLPGADDIMLGYQRRRSTTRSTPVASSACRLRRSSRSGCRMLEFSPRAKR